MQLQSPVTKQENLYNNWARVRYMVLQKKQTNKKLLALKKGVGIMREY